MHKICTSCDKPNARTYDLPVVIPGSPEKQKKNAKLVPRSPEAKSLQWGNFFMCISMECKMLDFFKYFPRITF